MNGKNFSTRKFVADNFECADLTAMGGAVKHSGPARETVYLGTV